MFDVVGCVSKEQRVREVYDLNFWIPLLTFMMPAHISEWAGVAEQPKSRRKGWGEGDGSVYVPLTYLSLQCPVCIMSCEKVFTSPPGYHETFLIWDLNPLHQRCGAKLTCLNVICYNVRNLLQAHAKLKQFVLEIKPRVDND